MTSRNQQGSVLLVAMCFVAVLGIALASYMAVSNQAMRLSNRTYLKGVSEQLAENGLEQALWSLNKSNWDPGVWTISGSTATWAKEFPNTKYGNGVTGSIKVRVDNYNAPFLSTAWNSTTPYVNSSIVSYAGVSEWNVSTAYSVDNLVNYAGVRYRCIVAHTGQTPPNPTYWAINYDYRSWYRCIAGNTNQAPPNPTYWENVTPNIYAEGIVILPGNGGAPIRTQLLAAISTASLFPNAAAATSTLNMNAGGTVDSYNADQDNDPTTVAAPPYSSLGSGYLAVLAGGSTTGTAVTLTNNVVQGYVAAPSGTSPPYAPRVTFGGSASLKNGVVVSPHPTAPNVDLTRISRSPYIPQFDPSPWDSERSYKINDVVRYSSNLYLCKSPPPANQDPGNTTYWTQNAYQPAISGTATIGTAGATTILYTTNVILNDGDTLTIQGSLILDVRGELKVRGTGKIVLEDSASAAIYVGGRVSIGSGSAAAAGIENRSKDPKRLILVGTVSSSPFPNRYLASLPFYGVIYMPKLTGSFTVNANIFGAISGKVVVFPSTANIHYDTSLRTATFSGIDSPFVITNWRELTDAADRITFP